MISFSNRIVAIAASVLAVLALLQLIVVIAALARRPAANPAYAVEKVEKAIAPRPTPKAKTTPAPAKKFVQGIENPPPMDTEDAGATSSQLPDVASDPNVSAENIPTTAPSEVDILIKRALASREKGDMSGTLAGLRDAQKLYPDDPKIIAEFANTYEQMGLVDKALAQWRRVMEAGEKAGDLYGVAAEKMKMGVMPRENVGGRDEEGLQIGSTFGLIDIQKNYENARDDSERVTLRTGIKVRSNAVVVPSQLNIQVMFYDLVNNTEVEPTDAKVTSEWLTTPVDWQQDGVEVLRVLYSPKPRAAGTGQDRKFLGYIVRVYYENELQDVYAEPVKLLKTFPPQLTLQKEIPQ